MMQARYRVQLVDAIMDTLIKALADAQRTSSSGESVSPGGTGSVPAGSDQVIAKSVKTSKLKPIQLECVGLRGCASNITRSVRTGLVG
jgi:hypothetical protein